MKKSVFIVALLIFAINVNAQDTTNKQKRIVDLSASFAAIQGDQVTNSIGIQFGAEFRLIKNVGIQCDLRYIFDVQSNNGYGYYIVYVDDLKGFALNTLIKVYRHQTRNNLNGGYFGGQALFMYTVAAQQETQVKRSKAGAYGILGWKHISRSGFLFESSFGIGVQFISSYSTNSTSVNYEHSYEFPWSKPYDSSSNFFPDLTWNIGIGWRF